MEERVMKEVERDREEWKSEGGEERGVGEGGMEKMQVVHNEK